MDKETKHLHLVLDQHDVDLYNRYYKVKNPRSRKDPIDRPIHPTLNRWSVMPRPAANALKAKWMDFTEFWLKKNNLEGMMLDDFEVTQTIYVSKRTRRDCDGSIPKFYLDQWTKSGFIVDDSYTYLHSLTLRIEYDKDYERTEFDIYYKK